MINTEKWADMAALYLDRNNTHGQVPPPSLSLSLYLSTSVQSGSLRCSRFLFSASERASERTFVLEVRPGLAYGWLGTWLVSLVPELAVTGSQVLDPEMWRLGIQFCLRQYQVLIIQGRDGFSFGQMRTLVCTNCKDAVVRSIFHSRNIMVRMDYSAHIPG